MTKKDTSQARDKKSIAPILKKMKVDQMEVYPISRMTVVKSCATLLSATKGFVFKTNTNRNDGVIIVTRTA